MVFWILLSGIRIGEARKPGPSCPDQMDFRWSVGCCNPSGLHGKQRLVHDLDADILAISETHLTARGRDVFRSGMCGLSSGPVSLVTGAPLESRVGGSDAGIFSGVAVLSKHPSRALSMEWPEDVFETGRLQFCTTFVRSVWITGAVCYGYPTGKLHVNARERTESLLQIGFDRLLQASGPRYFAGDWNHELTALSLPLRLQQYGWLEVQALEAKRTGHSPRVTCKGATRKDFLFLSPELAQWFDSLRIDDESFPDHSTLLCQFRGGPRSFDRFVWPCPLPVDWTSVPPLDCAVDFSSGDPTELYQYLWSQREAQAHPSCTNWTSKMGGRASKTRPIRRVGWPAPVKVGRSSDFQPKFHGCDVQHARWIRQLRRLHNFARWAKNRQPGNWASMDHGCRLWQSILKAPGFTPSFVEWWPSRSLVCDGDPAVVPSALPSQSVVEAILGAFHHEVRQYELLLDQSRAQLAKFQRESDPNVSFRDVKRPAPEPVATLIDSVQAHVIDLDVDDCSLVLNKPVQLDDVQPVWIGGRPQTVIHADSDKVWVQSLDGFSLNDPVAQAKYRGSLAEVFSAFHEQWQQRWCKHDKLPHAHWDQILEFARSQLPRHHVPHVPVDPDMLRAEAHRKKPTAATGLDGVSRSDILQACPQTLQSLCNLCSRAEATGLWPRQLVAGRVNSLAKTVGAATVNEYRPIVVYSLLYRLWSSLQARRQLDMADSWADPFLFGNRKGRHAAHLWRFLVHEIETCRDANVPLSGLCCDIEKAYNCLPRWPVLCAAMYVGTPDEVLNGWSGAMASMCRHFKVRDSLSEGFLTSTGLAEGDALSCYGMLLVDHLLHSWLQATQPEVRVLSYVDDWSFVVRDPTFAVAQLDLALQFCGMVDLTLDRQKTYGWSLDPRVRQHMRGAGIRVRHHAKDLGAHIAFSKQFTNCTIKDRFSALDQFWDQLRCSKCSYQRKTFLLKMVGWPRGLYGVSSVPLGTSVWVSLRRKACAALSMRKAGVNPLLLLGLVESFCDPQLVGSVLTFRDAREFLTPLHWDEFVKPFALGLLDLPHNAPSRILVSRLFTLGICPSWEGHVTDSFGAFDFLHGNYGEWIQRVEWHWQFFVASQVAHRDSFLGLAFVDCPAVRQTLARLPAPSQALLRLSLTGGFYTANAQSHWTERDNACKWCGLPDSPRHRLWQCVHTQALRDKLAPRAAACHMDLPPALALHGWAIRPPTWYPFVEALLSIPKTPPPRSLQLDPASWNHVFTDGSCYCQSEPRVRLAAWSAIVASPLTASWSLDPPVVLGASPLPGLVQTSFRAELFALCFVLDCAAQAGACVTVWTDCLAVVLRFHLLTRGKGRLKPNAPNADLWQWLLRSVEILTLERIQLKKVAAHRALGAAKTRQQFWETWHNAKADREAKVANLDRPSAFWDLWYAHSQMTATALTLFDEVVSLHVAVGHLSVATDEQQTLDEAPLPQPRVARTFEMRYDDSGWDGCLAQQFCHEYGPAMAQRFRRWWQVRVTQAPHSTLHWISLAHAYVDYQLTYGCAGPIQHKGKWLDPMLRPHLDPEKHTFQQRLRWFRRCVKSCCKQHQIVVQFETCRAHSDIVQAFVPCFSVPWDPWVLSQSEAWIASNVRIPVLRDVKGLRNLPVARQHRGMMLVEPESPSD